MNTTTTTTTAPGSEYSESVAAIRGLRDGADRWVLADSLLAEVGPGDSRTRFESVRVAAESVGVDPLSVSALRQYRDVAAHWPPADRIPGVSFSAHRAAVAADDPAGLLSDLADHHGPGGVTVKRVNTAVRGMAPKSGTPVDLGSASPADLVAELMNRDPDTLAPAMVADHVRDRLRRFVAEADRLAGVGKRKSATWSGPSKPTPAPTTDPATAAAPKPKPTRRPGDTRGLE